VSGGSDDLVLAIEGALGPLSVALASRDGGLERVAEVPANRGLERGLALVAEVLGAIPLDRLEAVAVSTGPGNYTGLRIALSYAKALAFARRLPLLPLASYDVLEPADATLPFAAFVSGRPGRVCARLRSGNDLLVSCGAEDEVAGALADAMQRTARAATLQCAGDWQGAAPRLGERGIVVVPISPFGRPFALALARRALHAPAAASPHAVRADYGET